MKIECDVPHMSILGQILYFQNLKNGDIFISDDTSFHMSDHKI